MLFEVFYSKLLYCFFPFFHLFSDNFGAAIKKRQFLWLVFAANPSAIYFSRTAWMENMIWRIQPRLSNKALAPDPEKKVMDTDRDQKKSWIFLRHQKVSLFGSHVGNSKFLPTDQIIPKTYTQEKKKYFISYFEFFFSFYLLSSSI